VGERGTRFADASGLTERVVPVFAAGASLFCEVLVGLTAGLAMFAGSDWFSPNAGTYASKKQIRRRNRMGLPLNFRSSLWPSVRAANGKYQAAEIIPGTHGSSCDRQTNLRAAAQNSKARGSKIARLSIPKRSSLVWLRSTEWEAVQVGKQRGR